MPRATTRTPRPPKTVCWLLSNLGKTCEGTIRNVFAVYGKVVNVRLHRNPRSRALMGTGEVWMVDAKDVDRAKEMLNGKVVMDDGRPMRVDKLARWGRERFWKEVLKDRKMRPDD